MSETGEIVTREDVGKPTGTSQYWQLELGAAHKREKTWREERAPKVVERFRDERDKADATMTVKTNILWSNTEILKSAIISESPSPDVRRRFMTSDKVGRNAALIIERSLSYCADAYDMDRTIECVVDDVLLPGRGVAWVVYEPTLTESDDIAYQEVRTDYVYWEDYREGHARTWALMPWVARRHTMTRDELEEAFPKHGEKVALTREIDGGPSDDKADVLKRADVWEIWDKGKRERVWVAEGYDTILRTDEDPYTLKDFFPCPEPVYAISNTKNRVPLPLYSQYQDQAKELDRISDRINNLVEQLKWRGVYDAAEGQNAGLKGLATSGDGTFIGVSNWAQFQSKGGLSGVFEAQEHKDLIEAVQALFIQREQLMNTIFQITGISDIVRGATDARETKGAQQLKSQFASLRIQRLFKRLNRFVRDLFRIKGEIIAEHFTQGRLAEMTQVDLPSRQEVEQQFAQAVAQGVQQLQQAVAQNPQGAQQAIQQGQQALSQLQAEKAETVTWEDVLEVLRSDDRRANKIDIETDQTAFQDAQAEKEARLEFVGAMTSMLETMFPAIQANPSIAPFGKELVLFAARSFKVGRVLEETLEDAFDQIQKQPQQPAPDPAVMKAEADIKALQAKVQIEGQKAQMDAQMKQQEQAGDMQMRQQEHAMDMESKRLELAYDAAAHRQDMQQDAEKAEQDRAIAETRARAQAEAARNRPQRAN
jgi:hypothetical protein